MKYQKGISALLIVGVIAVVLVFGGAAFYATQPSNEISNNEEVMMEKETDTMTPKDPAGAGPTGQVEKEGSEIMEEEKMMEKDSMMTKEAGSYESYSSEKLSKAEDGKVVLFFRAGWCPTCRALDADIRANLGNIPAGLTILDVDYDNSTALKQKYGVTYQHTLVQVDANGEMIKKWTNSQTLSALASQVI